MSALLRPRGDTAANWTAANPTLALREIGLETDTRMLKVGDGVTAWNSLSYYRAAGAIGSSQLVYRYTVSGSDKASIDTGADTPNAGSNDWTNGDLLEAFLVLRTDQTGTTTQVAVTLNNDTSSIYDRQIVSGVNTTLAAANASAAASWAYAVCGASYPANWPSTICIRIPNYAGTVFTKVGQSESSRLDSTVANAALIQTAIGYRSTSAITRLKVAPVTAGQKLVVGSEVLIYKRVTS